MNKIAVLSPLLVPLMRSVAERYEIVSLTDHASLKDLAAAHPDLTAAVMVGGERLLNEDIAAFKNLKLIAAFGVGYDGIDLQGARALGVTVTNCPNVNNRDVADHAVGLLIALARNIVGGHQFVLSGAWAGGHRGTMGPSLRQLKPGIVGMGAIGRSISERLPGFGMTDIAWWGPNPKDDIPYPRAESVLELARRSDVIFMAGRADETSRDIISAEVIEAIGPRGYLVNVSRGFTVDEDALIAALKEQRIAGAALDVFVQEPTPPERWRDVPNVVLTPHVGGGGRGAIEAQTRLVLENLDAHFAGAPLKTPLN